MHISKVSKSFNEEVSFLFNDDTIGIKYCIHRDCMLLSKGFLAGNDVSSKVMLGLEVL